MADKILLFGGSFDPVHHGHLVAARCVAEAGGFRQVLLIPAGTPPHKRPAVASARQRLDMLRLAVAGEPIFDVSDLEANRQGPSYTLDTLLALRQQLGQQVELHWLIGADMLADLHLWRHAQEILQLARIAVAPRPPWDRKLPEVFEGMGSHFSHEQIAQIQNSVYPVPLLDISSTQIRNRIFNGLSIRYLVPQSVCDYIQQHRVYSPGAIDQPSN